jgi:hypothetical protein
VYSAAKPLLAGWRLSDTTTSLSKNTPLRWNRVSSLQIENSRQRRPHRGGRRQKTLLEFAQPLVDDDPGRIDERRLRTLLGFAIHVWNLVVTEEVRDSGNDVAEPRTELASDQIPAEVLAWFDRLVVRKRERFQGDLRLVGNWRVVRGRDRLDIEMESRVPQAIHMKLTAAGLLS